MPVLRRSQAASVLRRKSKRGTVLYTELEAPLRRAVLLYWGSMAEARVALSLDAPAPARQVWSRKRVLDEIRRLHREGNHLSTVELVRTGHNDLLIAARRYVGSWSRARAIAGIDFKRSPAASTNAWDAQTVISTIRNRRRDDEPLALSKIPRSLKSAAERIFGSWRDAVTAAGLDYDEIALSRTFDDAELLAWLRALARKKPHMTLYDLDKHGEHTVVCRRRFGSLEAAARAAGIRGWPIRLRTPALSRSAVIRALRRWRKEGRKLNFAAVRDSDGGHFLLNSVFHHFATWDQAIRAAGLSPRAATGRRS